MRQEPSQKRRHPKLLYIGMVLLLAACEPNITQEGFPPASQMAKSLQTAGAADKQAVLQTLGTPSVRNNFGEDVWYYISAQKESLWFFAPETTRQDVLKLTFAPDGSIAQSQILTKEDGYDVAYSSKETPTEGHELGFAEQILGNVGRFNSPTGTNPTGTRSGGSAIPGRF